MNPKRFDEITRTYRRLKIGLVGDFCLDRYLEIDPSRQEVSIETGLPVHNVVNVRSQPGASGTVLNNLVALGIGTIFPVGFCGEDGEGMELERAMRTLRGVSLECFFRTAERRTFTYTKPLVMKAGKPPTELSRLDIKNWTPTPAALVRKMAAAVSGLSKRVDAFIVLQQVDVPGTGVVTRQILHALNAASQRRPALPIVADSRQSLREFPPFIFKMNADELARFTGKKRLSDLTKIKEVALNLAERNRRPVFVSLAERGALAAAPCGEVTHIPALPVRGPIDIVGAGDAVSANLTAALAAGASPREALELANAAASVVIHQLGTTGTASVNEIRSLIT